MGGTPILAMNIVGFPRNHPQAPLSALREILRGGADKATEANMSIVGGHTIDDDKPKYGMAVSGFVHPNKIWRNQGANIGDRLILTKPLGMGVITTALRVGAASDATMEEAMALMCMLNKGAAEVARDMDVHACTDITGFGFLGHVREMLSSHIDIAVRADDIPLIDGTRDLADAGHVPGGTRRNKASLESTVDYSDAVCERDREILCDAQTSGGLLFALTPEDAKKYIPACEAKAIPAFDVGEVVAGTGRIRVSK